MAVRWHQGAGSAVAVLRAVAVGRRLHDGVVDGGRELGPKQPQQRRGQLRLVDAPAAAFVVARQDVELQKCNDRCNIAVIAPLVVAR